MRPVGVITGSGGYDLPGLRDARAEEVSTKWGATQLTHGTYAGVPVVHLARHGDGHARLSNQVDHRAHLAALLACDVECVVSFTVCGSTHVNVPPGSLIMFDDIYFPSNRLPDGSLCTWHTTTGAKERGHWIFDSPFSEPLRAALLAAASELDVELVARGCYGHVDGPRFNSRTEIAALARLGVSAVSQTAGPEVVLAGEAELPYALVGFATDYASGIADPEPVEMLDTRMKQSSDVFAVLLERALPTITTPSPAGFVYRFEQ